MKFFWIVRHPLDAISSLKNGIGQNWRHHPRPPDWKNWLTKPLVEQCAHHWAYINSHGYERVGGLAKLVFFEDMIRDPHGFASDVCETLGIPQWENDALLRNWAERVQDSNNAQFVEAVTSRSLSRPDHSVRVGRWKENLSIDEARAASRIVAGVSQKFGYDVEEELGLC